MNFEQFVQLFLAPQAQVLGYHRMDAAASAFTARQLEHVFARTYDIKYATLKAREFIPVVPAPAGAESVTYEQWDQLGSAEFITNNATDLVRVDAKVTPFERPARMIGNSYGWNFNEILNMSFGNRPLSTKRQNAARRAHEEKLENTACFGSPVHGITEGFLNHSAVTVTNVPVGASTDEEWNTKTPAEILADVATQYTRIYDGTLEVEEPDTLLLPDEAYVFIATQQLTNTEKTTLSFIQDAYPRMKIMPWYRLNAAGAAGEGRAVMYRRDPEVVQQSILLDFTQLPPEARGLEMLINCVSKTAGTSIQYPKAVDYADRVS